MREQFCGFDFGTSNSTLGIISKGRPKLVNLEGNHRNIPSAILFDHNRRIPIFGREAMSSYTNGTPGRLMRSLKSVLGTSLMDHYTLVFNRNESFTNIIGLLTKHIKDKAEIENGRELTEVVVGRPVQFVDDNKTADQDAQNSLEKIMRSSGFKNIKFQYEPIAAALKYEESVESEEIALIVDIGGGTSDFSVVRVSPDRINNSDRKDDVLSNLGIHIGGTDFDSLLSIESVMPSLGYGGEMHRGYGEKGTLPMPTMTYHDLATWEKINFLYNKQTRHSVSQLVREAVETDKVEKLKTVIENKLGHRIASSVEKAKIELSEAEAAFINLSFIGDGASVIADRVSFNDAIKNKVNKVQAKALETISMSGLTPKDIDVVFFTGGSSSIPAIKESIKALVPGTKTVEGDLFGSVGLGLTIEAKRIFGDKKQSLLEPTL